MTDDLCTLISEHHRQLGSIADALGIPYTTDSPTKTVSQIIEAIRPMRAQFIKEEREACAKVALDVFVGNTEIPTRDSNESRMWRECAEFILDEIRSRE